MNMTDFRLESEEPNQNAGSRSPGVRGSANGDGYCWCDMCGFNARVKAKDRAQAEDEHQCPCCDEVGMMSFLSVGDKLADHVAPDSPMETYSPNHRI